jgi:RNA polymerase sigma-70 factor (ECF subfamily)
MWTDEYAEEKQLAASRIKKEIGTMLEPCKSLIILFYYDSLSFKEIASRMGYKNEGVAKNQKKRCLQKLREATQNLENENRF